MKCFEIIELFCTLISTLSAICSATLLGYHFLKKISVYAIYENGCILLYASALTQQMHIKRMDIIVDKKIINENDIFFANGDNKIQLDVKEFVKLKQIPFKGCKPKKIKIKIYLFDNTILKSTCKIRG